MVLEWQAQSGLVWARKLDRVSAVLSVSKSGTPSVLVMVPMSAPMWSALVHLFRRLHAWACQWAQEKVEMWAMPSVPMSARGLAGLLAAGSNESTVKS